MNATNKVIKLEHVRARYQKRVAEEVRREYEALKNPPPPERFCWPTNDDRPESGLVVAAIALSGFFLMAIGAIIAGLLLSGCGNADATGDHIKLYAPKPLDRADFFRAAICAEGEDGRYFEEPELKPCMVKLTRIGAADIVTLYSMDRAYGHVKLKSGALCVHDGVLDENGVDTVGVSRGCRKEGIGP